MINIQLENMTMNFKLTPDFSRDFKKLLKKYKTLEQDLDNFKRNVREVDLRANKNFAVLYMNEQVMIIKARFFCRYLKGKTLRIVFAYFIDKKKIVFIELFYKGDKQREDKQRYKYFLK